MRQHWGFCAISLLVLACSNGLLAQQATIFPFMRTLQPARTAALGGSTVALIGEGSNVVVNPAVLATTDTTDIHATFIKHVADINGGLATYVTDVDEHFVGAITVGYTNYGDFRRSTVDGTTTGSFTASDFVVGFSVARELDTLITYGVSAKVLHSSLSDMRTTAVALDAGLLFRFPAKRTNIGISVTNLGTQLSTYDGTSDRLPIDVRIGLNHRLRGLPLMVNVSFNQLADDVDDLGQRLSNFSIGGEFYIGKYVQFRVAYDNALRNSSAVNISTQLSGISAGLGVKLRSLDFNYALNVLGASAVLHRITLATSL